MTPAGLTVSRRRGLSLLRLERPPTGLLGSDCWDDLTRELLAAETRQEPVVLLGLGHDAPPPAEELLDPEQLEEGARRLHELLALMTSLGEPVLAAARGHLTGASCSLALAAHACLLASDASLAPCDAAGRPAVGLARRLAGRLGQGECLDVLRRDRPLSAEACVDFGLAQRVVPADELEEAAEHWHAELVARGPEWRRLVLRCTGEAVELGPDEAAFLEASLLGLLPQPAEPR
ncbi:MAG: enoyl-CoA hydratase-related protein [Acidobacteriota bacterium]